jgi:hypothetical protein
VPLDLKQNVFVKILDEDTQSVSKRDIKKKRHTDRETDRHKDRETETDRDRQRNKS